MPEDFSAHKEQRSGTITGKDSSAVWRRQVHPVIFFSDDQQEEETKYEGPDQA